MACNHGCHGPSACATLIPNSLDMCTIGVHIMTSMTIMICHDMSVSRTPNITESSKGIFGRLEMILRARTRFLVFLLAGNVVVFLYRLSCADSAKSLTLVTAKLETWHFLVSHLVFRLSELLCIAICTVSHMDTKSSDRSP